MAVKPDMVGIIVKDMAEALRFYRLLGLDIPEGAESEPHVEITANGYRIAWDTEELVRSFAPHWQPPTGHRISLAFKCDSPAEVDEVYQRLIAAGARSAAEPWDAVWGQRYAMIQDPDGNHLDIFAPIPETAAGGA